MKRDLFSQTARDLQHAPARLTDAADDLSTTVSEKLAPWLARHAIIAAILLLAFILRCQQLRQPLTDAFSWRQASTAMMADNYYRTSANIFFPEVSWTGPGPSYQGREFQLVTWTTSILYRVFGQHEWLGRFIGVVAGTWGVFAIFMLTRRVWNKQSAYWVSLTLAILPGAVFIDRSFLPDPTMLALTLTAAWLYIEYLCSDTRKWLIALGIVGTLAWLTKLPGIILLAPMIYATIVIFRERRCLTLRRLRPIGITLGCMILVIGCYYAWAIYLGTHYPPYHIAGASNWVWKDSFDWWIEKNYFLPRIFSHAWDWMWTAPFAIMLILGLLHAPPGTIDRVPPDPEAPMKEYAAPWFFHFWFLGAMIVVAIGARELSENPWNLHIFNVFAAAMAGYWLYLVSRFTEDRVPKWGSIGRATAIALIALIAGQVLVKPMYYAHATDSHNLGRALERVSAKGDLVATIADDVGDPIAIYYSHRRGYVFPQQHLKKTWAAFNLFPNKESKIKYMLEDLRARDVKWLGIVADPRDDTPGATNFWTDHAEFVAYVNKTCDFVEKTNSHVIYRIKSYEELGWPRMAPIIE